MFNLLHQPGGYLVSENHFIIHKMTLHEADQALKSFINILNPT